MSISTRAAVDAARRVGADLGISAGDPVVLHDGSNVVVHLRPAPVVAKVASRTALIRPGVEAWLSRDIAVARHVAARGVAATEPLAEPRHVDGAVVALWRYEPHSAAVLEPATVAASLAELHAALADYAGPLPAAGPVDDLLNTLDVLEPSATVTGLRERVAPLAAAVAVMPTRPLHGDAHPGNLLVTPRGLVWNDFEDAWRGPLAWDLACLATTGRLDGRAAVAAYPDPPPADELAVCLELRELFGEAWRLLIASAAQRCGG
jgi:Ser/Thr protein kinase RdoA (MazF antagonist)